MKIEVYIRNGKPDGLYISGDLSDPVPSTIRKVKKGKSTDVVIEEWAGKTLHDLYIAPLIKYLTEKS